MVVDESDVGRKCSAILQVCLSYSMTESVSEYCLKEPARASTCANVVQQCTFHAARDRIKIIFHLLRGVKLERSNLAQGPLRPSLLRFWFRQSQLGYG